MKFEIEKKEKEIRKFCKGNLILNEPMWKHTSMRIGGEADIYFEPSDINDLKNCILFAAENKIPWMILGGGTNLIVSDFGIEGIVINVCQGFRNLKIIEREAENALVEAEAGVFLPHLLNYINSKGFSDFDFLTGIPGTVGGAIKMNAGTSEGEIKDICERIQVLREGKFELLLRNEEIGFSYRKTCFENDDVILKGYFKLKKGITGKDKKIRENLRKKRIESQPIGLPSAGSIFKNPNKDVFAGKLIELCGLKGLKKGGAEISPVHANFIVNNGGAKADDVLELIETARDKVRSVFGILLECEVKIVGRNV